MKRLRFLNGTGDDTAVIPDGQVLFLSVAAGLTLGTWLKINESEPIFVPAGYTLGLDALAFGMCCGESECDRYPGERGITVVIGTAAAPLTGDPPEPTESDPPLSWLIVYNGC